MPVFATPNFNACLSDLGYQFALTLNRQMTTSRMATPAVVSAIAAHPAGLLGAFDQANRGHSGDPAYPDNGYILPEFVRYALQVLIARSWNPGGVTSANAQIYGVNGLEWLLARQNVDGSFADATFDPVHSVGFMLRVWGPQTLANRTTGAYPAQQARWQQAFLNTALWYFGAAQLARIDTGKTHRLAYTAQIAMTCYALTGDPMWLAWAKLYAQMALTAQDPAGFYPESTDLGGTVALRSGPDASYNCVDIQDLSYWYLLACDCGVVDPLVADVRASLVRACAWEESKQLPDGSVDVSDSIRVGPNGEVDRNGNPKGMDNREFGAAMNAAAYATGRRQDWDSMIAMLRYQGWMGTHDTAVYAVVSPNPPTPPPPPAAPKPVLTDVLPASVVAGGEALTLTVSGTGFDVTSIVKWNGKSQPTTFVSDTQLTATIPASLVAGAGTSQITVTTPHVATSDPVTFTITVAAAGGTGGGSGGGTGAGTGQLVMVWK